MLLWVFERVMKTFFWNCSDWMTKPLVTKLIIRLITHDPETVYQFLQFGLLICQHVTYSQLGWDLFWFAVMCYCGREYYTICYAANGNCQATPLSPANKDSSVTWHDCDVIYFIVNLLKRHEASYNLSGQQHRLCFNQTRTVTALVWIHP